MEQSAELQIATISKQVFVAVEPVRIAVYAIALSIPPDGADRPGEIVRDRIATSVDHIETAFKMLAKTFPDLLKRGGHVLPAELMAQYEAALKAVSAVRAEISPEMLGEDQALPPGLRFTDDLLHRLDTNVRVFLAELEANATEVTRASFKDDHAVIKGAVAEIRKISMSINLISINASIEAARAGEAGRGFGVIANEIQTLSLRSQASLEQIVKSVGT
ncbi:MAG: methyl-accepting chemotaxis protein [Pseudomonadota bacterium]